MGSSIKMKKLKICLLIGIFILLVIVAFFLGIVIKTAVFKPPASYKDGFTLPTIENLPSNRNTSNYLTNLREAIKLKTISYDNGSTVNSDQFYKMHSLIVKSFPYIHTASFVKRSVVNNYSLLYEIIGSDASLAPALLVSHLDVVPTEDQKWNVNPFEALMKDGFIYGRGTIDNKPVVFAILEALELFLSQNLRPKRSILICLGHDEEIGGFTGAQKVSEELILRGYTKLLLVLDEGTPIVKNMMGVKQPVAMLSVAEKGYLTVELSVEYGGGHSSMPDKESSISILSAALVRLNSQPHPACLSNDDIFTMALKKLAPFMNYWNKMAIANIDLFRNLIIKFLSKEAPVDAILRTTTAITQFHAGTKNNILPQRAVAIVNHRVHPSVTLEEAIEYDREVIADHRVKVKTIRAVNPTPISPYLSEDALVYSLLEQNLQMIDSDIIVVPGLLVGNTDSRWFKNLSNKIYKTSPILMSREDLSGYHGSNERISVKSYLQAIDFYYRLMRYIDVLNDRD